MPDKYLSNNAGIPRERTSFDSSSGPSDAGRIVALNANGEIDPTMLPPGLGDAEYSIQASQNLNAGDFINIFNDGGSRIRKADASNIATKAHGYVLEPVVSGNMADVFTDSKNNQLADLIPGFDYFLSADVPGEVTATAPSTSGQIAQRLGVSVDATVLDVEISQPIILT